MSCVGECKVKKKQVSLQDIVAKSQCLRTLMKKQCNRTSHRNKNVEMKNYCAQNLICATGWARYFTVSEVIDREGPSVAEV